MEGKTKIRPHWPTSQFILCKLLILLWRRGGIRTRSATIRPATCGFHVAKGAIDATVAMAAWPILAHGEIELNNCRPESPQVEQAPESRQQAVRFFGTHGSPAPKRACRHDCRHGRLRVCATGMAEAKVKPAGSSSPASDSIAVAKSSARLIGLPRLTIRETARRYSKRSSPETR
jgi:hypothetical protein